MTNSMDKALDHLRRADSAFAKFLRDAPACELDKPFHQSDFETLVFAIVGQQISAKAADAITLRVLEISGRPLTPEKVLDMGSDGLRECGFTRAKARTVTEAAQAVVEGRLNFGELVGLNDQETVAYLSRFWGIGPWTSHMLMIFRLGRLDIWPIGDLGVRKGWSIIHGLDHVLSPEQLKQAADHLCPFRSVAAWYCWVATREDSLFW